MKPLNNKERRNSHIKAILWTLVPMLLFGFTIHSYSTVSNLGNEKESRLVQDCQANLEQLQVNKTNLEQLLTIYVQHYEIQNIENYHLKSGELFAKIGGITFNDFSVGDSIKSILTAEIKQKGLFFMELEQHRLDSIEAVAAQVYEDLGKEKVKIKKARVEVEMAQQEVASSQVENKNLLVYKAATQKSINTIVNAFFDKNSKKRKFVLTNSKGNDAIKILVNELGELSNLCGGQSISGNHKKLD